MNVKKFAAVCIASLSSVALVGAIAFADPAKDAGGAPQMQLPPGWTEADMKACMEAGTPGAKHAWLAKGVGTWIGKQQMWMFPGSEPVSSTCTSKVTSVMDNRYFKVEMTGEIPGMGPFNGFGIYGFDNVTQEFVGTWIDNCGTGIMNGTGKLESDGTTLTWKYDYNCPMTKKPTVMREVEKFTGPNTKTLEMFAIDPKSGKEYQMLRVEFTKQ